MTSSNVIGIGTELGVACAASAWESDGVAPALTVSADPVCCAALAEPTGVTIATHSANAAAWKFDKGRRLLLTVSAASKAHDEMDRAHRAVREWRPGKDARKQVPDRLSMD